MIMALAVPQRERDQCTSRRTAAKAGTLTSWQETRLYREGISSMVGVCTVLRIKRPYRPMAPHTPNFDPLDPGPLKLRLPSGVPLNICEGPSSKSQKASRSFPEHFVPYPILSLPGEQGFTEHSRGFARSLAWSKGPQTTNKDMGEVTTAAGSQDHASQSSSQTLLDAVAADPIDRSTRS